MAKFRLEIEVTGHDDAWPYEDVASVVTYVAGRIRNADEAGDIHLGRVVAHWRITRERVQVPLAPGWETDRSGPPDSPVEAASRGYGRSA